MMREMAQCLLSRPGRSREGGTEGLEDMHDAQRPIALCWEALYTLSASLRLVRTNEDLATLRSLRPGTRSIRQVMLEHGWTYATRLASQLAMRSDAHICAGESAVVLRSRHDLVLESVHIHYDLFT